MNINKNIERQAYISFIIREFHFWYLLSVSLEDFISVNPNSCYYLVCLRISKSRRSFTLKLTNLRNFKDFQNPCIMLTIFRVPFSVNWKYVDYAAPIKQLRQLYIHNNLCHKGELSFSIFRSFKSHWCLILDVVKNCF